MLLAPSVAALFPEWRLGGGRGAGLGLPSMCQHHHPQQGHLNGRMDPGGDRRQLGHGPGADVFHMHSVVDSLNENCDFYEDSLYSPPGLNLNAKNFMPMSHQSCPFATGLHGSGAAPCRPLGTAGGGAPTSLNVNNVQTTLDSRGVCTVVLSHWLSYKLLWHVLPVRRSSASGLNSQTVITECAGRNPKHMGATSGNNGASSAGYVAGAKYYLPLELCKPPDNLVGRLLGPSGITVKRLEQTTSCKIVLCGRGSVKNAAKEARLVGKAGWEHLDEPLHVLVEATEQCDSDAGAVLEKGVCTVSEVLTPVGNDEFKRQQLVELAIMNGTYRATRRSQAVVPNGDYRRQINLRYDEEGLCPYNVMRQLHQQHARKRRSIGNSPTAGQNFGCDQNIDDQSDENCDGK